MQPTDDALEIDPQLGEAFYKTLLESTKAIPWQIDWQTMRFTYIGPQIETLLGWTAASWVSADDWAARMHPDDREWVVNFCVSQSQEGVDHEADYRALTADGRYVWIRDVVHVIREGGQVRSLVGFMFDISERKQQENELLRLQKELEALSYQDALTGLANRRLFEQTLQREWSSALRNQQPLSLVMLDVDEFKQYNDRYGHTAGDNALKNIATQLVAVLRVSDLAARIGGEEFVVVLPNTTEQEAAQAAERIREAIQAAAIEHSASRVASCLTVSLGLGTIMPAEAEGAARFVDAVDRELYRAKREGRNRCAALDVWPLLPQ